MLRKIYRVLPLFVVQWIASKKCEVVRQGKSEFYVGDIHYEYDMGLGIKCEVLTKPTKNEDGNWTWKSKNVNSDKEIDYLVNPKYSHYSSNLYDYEAYKVKHYI